MHLTQAQAFPLQPSLVSVELSRTRLNVSALVPDLKSGKHGLKSARKTEAFAMRRKGGYPVITKAWMPSTLIFEKYFELTAKI